MGNDIFLGVSFKSVYFHFFSTYVSRQLSSQKKAETRTSKGSDVITH